MRRPRRRSSRPPAPDRRAGSPRVRLLGGALLALTLAPAPPAAAQRAVGLELFALSIHPGGAPQAHLYPNKLDDRGYLVLTPGIVASYQHPVLGERLALEVAQAAFLDCAAQPAGLSHLGLRWTALRVGPHALGVALGPTLLYRRDWNRIPGYVDTDRFTRRGGWQLLFLWAGLEVEYRRAVRPAGELTLSVAPHPQLVGLGLGYRHRLDPTSSDAR